MGFAERKVCAVFRWPCLALVVAAAAIASAPRHAFATTRRFEAPHRSLDSAPSSSSLSSSASSSRPCSSSNQDLLGFAVLNSGEDHLSNSLDHKQAVELRTCLKDCLSFPSHRCVMVLAIPASPNEAAGNGSLSLSPASTVDCWLKDSAPLGNSTLTAPNSAAQAFVLPCMQPGACGNESDTCEPQRAPDDSAVSCTCSALDERRMAEMGFVPHPTNYTAQFDSENMRGGYITDIEPYDCVAKCSVTDGCFLAITSPATRTCFLREDGSGAAVLDPTLRVFVSACAINLNNCPREDVCRRANPAECVDPNEEYGFYFEAYKKDYQGEELWSGNVADQAECVRRCAENENCTTAQTAPGRQKCWLKKSKKESFSTGSDQIVFWRNESAVGKFKKSSSSTWQIPFVAVFVNILVICASCIFDITVL